MFEAVPLFFRNSLPKFSVTGPVPSGVGVAEAAVAARHGRPRAVPVRVAWLPGVEATWSTGGVLTLSLAHNDRWGSKVTPRCFTILVHEIAHHFGIDDDRLHDLGYA